MHYDGGKAGPGVYHSIINQVPPHSTYISPFAGYDAVRRFMRPSERSILVDLDDQVVALWASWPGVEARQEDALVFLQSYPWSGTEFVYCDPPYLRSVRSSQRRLYRHEFWTDDQHSALLDVLASLPCSVALSGYDSELYSRRLDSWRTVTFQTSNRAGRPVTEWLWLNYPPPLELHDYSFLGADYRDRERIKRKRQRWADRLRRLPELERFALLAALDDVRRKGARTLATSDDAPARAGQPRQK